MISPLGVFLGYKNHTYDVSRFFLQAQYTSGTLTYTRDPISGLKLQSDVIAKGFAFFTGADFHYFRWPHFSVYSGLSAGIAHIDIKVNTVLKDKGAEPFSGVYPFTGSIFFFQFRVLAFEFKPTDHFSFFTEFNGGSSSVGLYNSIGIAFGANYHL